MTKFVTEVIERGIISLKPYARNARTHSKKQIRQIASSIERFGFVNPVLIGDDGEIIAGHGRVEAAKLLDPTGRKNLSARIYGTGNHVLPLAVARVIRHHCHLGRLAIALLT